MRKRLKQEVKLPAFAVTMIISIVILAAGICPLISYAATAESMDVNDFESTMTVGSTQTISVILYPDDAEDEIKYSSSNTAVASISRGGKITAKSAGSSNITVTAGKISQTLPLTVESVSIEVNDFEKEMNVGDTQTISVNLYPSSASDKITYSSSSPSVATISQGGKIEAKAAGTTEITVSAGGTSKTMTLTVSVGTTGISLNSTYITLMRGEKYTLKAKVSPKTANQSLTYKSSDTSVAKVSNKGVIKAVGLGSASILVSNGNLTTSCDVIVNSGTSGDGTMYFGSAITEDQPEDKPVGDNSTDAITADRLRNLQKTGNALTIEKKDYDIILEGSSIVNADNKLSDELHITKNEDGYTMSVGGGTDFLPGEISIVFKDADMQKCKYVYLLDKDSDKYKLFAELSENGYRTDIAGTYHITYDKLKGDGLDRKKGVVVLVVIALLIGGYLVYKRIF